MDSSQLDLKTIFENVQRDASLFSTLDIKELLDKMEKSSYLEGKTMRDIQEEKVAVLEGLGAENSAEILEKLKEYRYIKNTYELHKGKHIRWIKIGQRPIVLNRGAVFTDFLFHDKGTNLQCLQYGYGGKRNTFQIRMDEHIIFQKMSTEELLLLTIYENIQTGKIK